MASAQVKSALILAGLQAEGQTILTGKIESRDHTEKMLAQFGVNLEITKDQIVINGGQNFTVQMYLYLGTFLQQPFLLY